MINKLSAWLVIFLLGLAILGTNYRDVSASANNHSQGNLLHAGNQQAAPTVIPISEPVSLSGPTPQPRVLPPVGRNASLVIGASVLVLIIIGGVLSSRLRAKH